ncbi:MAG: hypothetical protein ACKVRP_12440 [Bacteroidota bacterium]
MKLSFSFEEIEKWRDKVHRRTPRLAVRTKQQAMAFVNDVGFCFAFKSVNSELPCLWHAATGERHPVLPVHTHSDPCLSFVWKMKNILPSEMKAYYGKVLKRRPTMISLELFPYFYALAERTGAKDEYLDEFRRGNVSPIAKSIMDALTDSSPQVTKGLKLATGNHTKADRPRFDKAMAELQAKMYIVKVAEHYNPFTFEWALVHKAYPQQVRAARKVNVEEARVKILERYFRNQFVCSVPDIARLFGWDRRSIYQSLGHLVNRGLITANVKIDEKTTKYYCLID